MIIKPYRKIFAAVFVLSFLLFFPIGACVDNAYADQNYGLNQPHKNILVLNSYNQGLAWTLDQDLGIIETIKKSYSNSSIFVEDMDWKNYPTGTNLEYLKEYYKYKYQNKKIDAIITTDDIALTFALSNRKEIFSNAPLVFSGVNKEGLFQINRRYNNFTGVVEVIDPVETVKIAMKINPSLKNIYVLFDNSESGRSTGKIVLDKIKEMDLGLNTITLNKLSFGELIQKVKAIGDDSIILITTYYSDGDGHIIEFDSASREVSTNSKVPVYHLYDFGMNNGALGGDLLSGSLNGAKAAKLASRILNGEVADNIPIDFSKTTKKVFDYNQLKKFNIPLDKLPKGSVILNKPFSFFETYKTLVIAVVLAFIVLVIYIVILSVHIKKIRKMKKELANQNEELTQIYEELVASDEEIKVQLDQVNTVKKSLEISEEKYTYLALHDVLTGLPNRRSLYEDSKELINSQDDLLTAILFIDMDNFKFINDSLGHDFGDKLIGKVSERLLQCLDNNSKLYRLGGDEFIILLQGIRDKAEVEKITESIIRCSKKEVPIQNSSLHVSFSIGIALFPEHGENIEDLIKSADIAMYKAKEEGRNRYVVYDKCMNKVFTERMIIERHLHTAMENGEFEVYYQPQLNIKTNRIAGFEALLRWKSPELGDVSPIKFIKIAEETHIIIPLGEWVLFQACDFITQMKNLGYNDLTVSVNISILQLLQADFAERVSNILDHFELEHSRLELEITESVLIESFDLVNNRLKLLSEKGIGIALDDFGKGYSSLSYLRQLPITTLKIDKCFIDDVTKKNETEILTQHIINMGRSLGISVVAEGVEKQEQMDFLMKYECDKIQGYLFSKPIPQRKMVEILVAHFSDKEADCPPL